MMAGSGRSVSGKIGGSLESELGRRDVPGVFRGCGPDEICLLISEREVGNS